MRDALDRYYTPAHATEALLQVIGPRLAQSGNDVVEPCSGAGGMCEVLRMYGVRVRTNDLSRRVQADTHDDASAPAFWRGLHPRPAWVITNPPFSRAAPLLQLAYAAATEGVALLLRLSFLEPCANRGAWLAAHPPSRLIAVPRISFTGDGRTDSVACAWLVWDKRVSPAASPIRVVPKPPRPRAAGLL